MYTCRKCKSEIEDDDRYCFYCGAYIGEPAIVKDNWEALNNGKDSSLTELYKGFIYICNKCSNSIKYEDIFCRNCGIELTDILKKECVITDSKENKALNSIKKRSYSFKFNIRDIISIKGYKGIFVLLIIILIFISAVLAKNTIFAYKETHGIFDNVFMASEGENVYYTSINRQLNPLASSLPDSTIYKITGNKAEKIFEGFAAFLNAKNNWLYYIDNTDNDSVYKVKTDGTEKQKLLNGIVEGLKVEGNYIYYITYKDNVYSNELKRMKLDRTNQRSISSDVLSYQVVGNTIYYSSSHELGVVYKTNLDGSNKTKLCTIDGPILYVKDGYIYYRGQEGNTTSRGYVGGSNISDFLYGNGYLCRIKINGTGKETLIKKNNITNIVFYNNYIIYQDTIKNFYKLDLNGKNEVLILDQNINHLQISIANNYMYYCDEKENKIYKKSLDSKEVIAIDLTSK